MTPALLAWPRQAEVHKPVPKSKIYAHAHPSRAVRERFVSEVDQIVWTHKLAPETVNLPSRPGVPEIEVFQVRLRTDDWSETVLRTIDRAIPFPIVFEVCVGERVRSVAAYKRPTLAGGSQWVVDAYFATPWQPAQSPRAPLPTALDLGSLYEQVLQRQIGLAARPGELLPQLVERANAIRVLQGEAGKLEVRLRQEKQFNRKVELNQQLRTVRNEIGRLLRQPDENEIETP